MVSFRELVSLAPTEEAEGPFENLLFHSLVRLAAVRSGGGGRGVWSSAFRVQSQVTVNDAKSFL